MHIYIYVTTRNTCTQQPLAHFTVSLSSEISKGTI